MYIHIYTYIVLTHDPSLSLSHAGYTYTEDHFPTQTTPLLPRWP